MYTKPVDGKPFWSRSLVGVMFGALLASGAAQTASLASLTVPESSLPEGCRLEVSEAKPSADVQPGVANTFAIGPWYPFPSNPWSGTDRGLLLAARGNIDDGPRKVPDGPPMGAAEISAMRQRWVAHVVEGYRASYTSAERVAVQVFAITFDDEALATTGLLTGREYASRDVSDRVVLGASVVLVRTKVRTGCFDAIDAYIRLMK